MTKADLPTEKSKNQNDTKSPSPKTSIEQRLRNDSITLSKSSEGHSLVVVELGPDKDVVQSTTIYFNILAHWYLGKKSMN